MDAAKNLKVEVSFSPELFSVYHNPHAIVVVIDVLRATSAICAAFENGVKQIIPVATVEEAKAYQQKGYLVGAERKGKIVEGFDFGNSPFAYMTDQVKGETIVLTTTNGTRAIKIAENVHQVVIGSFVNLSALSNWLINQQKDVLLLCAGWKDRFNLEDTLLAGAVTDQLLQNPEFNNIADSALAAQHLYNLAKDDMFRFLDNSSHRRRLGKLDLDKDINYCLSPDKTSVIPALEEDRLVNLMGCSEV